MGRMIDFLMIHGYTAFTSAAIFSKTFFGLLFSRSAFTIIIPQAEIVRVEKGMQRMECRYHNNSQGFSLVSMTITVTH